jgi:hypothetical protein
LLEDILESYENNDELFSEKELKVFGEEVH